MAQVVDSPRFRIDSDSDEEIDIELGDRVDPTSETPNEQNLEHDTASLLAPDRRRKRVRIAILAVSFLFLLGVCIGLAARFSREQPKSINTGIDDDFTVSFGSLETIGGEEVQNGGVVPFLDAQFTPDERSVFVLSKMHWNSSFIVYPTVVRREAPVKVGLERGGILLETNDFVFHFELSPNGRYLQLVQEFHYASLRGDKADELQQMFDDSQWPGYAIKVPIYMETDSAYYIPSDAFLSNGFFVSSALVSNDFTVVEDRSESFARNTMLIVEYELASGILEVNFAIGLLPDEVMAQRVADDRIGYFSKRFTQYSIRDQELSDGNGFHWWDPQITVVHRRKLELDADGNTTKEPITYYIDPSVPREWREAFATGVRAWVPAFERIGFPNAIRVVLPGDDDWPIDYRLGDLRYNSISVMISKETYAYGPAVIDPRSGEILHSDIVMEYGFFNEVIADFDFKSLTGPLQVMNDEVDASNLLNNSKKFSHVRTGRTQQCGIAHEQQNQLDRMMLRSFVGDEDGYVPKRLIAQHFASIIMHEVGHTLGLRHNFAGSTAYSRDQLRNTSFVAEHGLSTSIMDYLPANIFSDLTLDEVDSHPFFMTTIGEYDYAAIAYGYSMIKDETPGYKTPRLTELAAAAPLFLTDEALENMLNPYAQAFDLSSDLIDYAADRLQLVKNARVSQTALNKLPDDASWTTLWQREYFQLRIIERAIQIVRPFLGGVYVTHAHRIKGEGVFNASYVPAETQLGALNVLLRIVEAESGLFPDPKDYGLYMEVVGFDKENCNDETLDYNCLGRGLVDVGGYILNVRVQALLSAIFPAMNRIVQQDVLSPLTLNELLAPIFATVASMNASSETLVAFLEETLQNVISNRKTDARIKKAIEAKWGISEPPVVVVAKAGK
ncbi:unnamed protein product [Phytophthora fragariaefolia]|uniref:Unnamed protein product n=1 Tax=Phytophthora fragariaefolia TaxID=1490495 RepID=A0A9W6TNV9_9STRA|nr:unnamed protein product [Phytophthora fragariaefolia]